MTNTTSPPNILFIFPDQWRWDWLGCHDGSATPYGDIPVRTPNLDALAARGTRLTRCYTNSPVCAPARACLARGRRYERCGVPGNGVNTPVDADNTFKRLRDAGYRTACTGKTDLQKHGMYKGLDGWTPAMGQLGFVDSANQCGKWDAVNCGAQAPADPYMKLLHETGYAARHVDDYNRRHAMRHDDAKKAIDPTPSPLPRALCTDDFCGQQSLDRLCHWPVAAPDQPASPWMLWVNFPGPHEPFDPPAELQQRYDGVDFPPPVDWPGDAPAQAHQQLRRNYAAMCEGIDDWVGRLLDQVKARGEWDNTLVIFASDHGELLGDHGRWYKARPEEGSTRVPLIVAGPGVPEGQLDDSPVELIDIAATMLAAAGTDPLDDADARPLPTHGGTPRDHVCSALHDWSMVVRGQHKFIMEKGQPDRLYDLAADPAELHNLADEQPETVETMRQLLPAAAHNE